MYEVRFVAKNRWEVTDEQGRIVVVGTIRQCGDWLARQGRAHSGGAVLDFCRRSWRRITFSLQALFLSLARARWRPQPDESQSRFPGRPGV